MKEDQSESERESAKKKAAADERYAYTKEAGIEREGMARSEQSALPTEGMGEKPDAGYWDDMNPKDSTDTAQNKSQFGVFEKEGGSGPTVIKPGRDFSKGKDPRSLNKSGVYAEKDAQVWKDMAKSSGDKDAEWSGTPSDKSSEIVGAPTGASKKASETPAGTQGQHWRGEPWAKNPKVGGKEKTGTEGEPGTSGQHWRGEDMPPEKKAGGESQKTGKSTGQQDRK